MEVIYKLESLVWFTQIGYEKYPLQFVVISISPSISEGAPHSGCDKGHTGWFGAC
jgi:hypothetical protein